MYALMQNVFVVENAYASPFCRNFRSIDFYGRNFHIPLKSTHSALSTHPMNGNLRTLLWRCQPMDGGKKTTTSALTDGKKKRNSVAFNNTLDSRVLN